MFFDIFWDILDEKKSNLNQECVKSRLLSFQGQIGTIAPYFSGKMKVFPVLALLFYLSLLKVKHFYPYKIYIFGLRNSRAIR